MVVKSREETLMGICCRHGCGATDSVLHQEKAFLPSDALQSMAKINEQTVATVPTKS